MVVPGSRTSSLRPKIFLVPRLAHHHSRCRPLRSHRRPRQMCVASLAARHPRRATHASQSQKSTSRPTYSRLTSSPTANATTPVSLVTLVHSCACPPQLVLQAFLPLLNTLRIQAIQLDTSASTSSSNVSSLPPHSAPSSPSTPPSTSTPNI